MIRSVGMKYYVILCSVLILGYEYEIFAPAGRLATCDTRRGRCTNNEKVKILRESIKPSVKNVDSNIGLT